MTWGPEEFKTNSFWMWSNNDTRTQTSGFDIKNYTRTYAHSLENDTTLCVSSLSEGFYDDGTSTYKQCYDSCGTCSLKGDDDSHQCTTCKRNYKYLEDNIHNCYKKSSDGYYDDGSVAYMKCDS